MATIETIGYGGKKPDDFFRKLEALNPSIVVDVRENPYNAFLGVYTLHQLEKRLGSKYIWIKERALQKLRKETFLGAQL